MDVNWRRIGVIVLLILVLLYSFLFANQPLLGVVIILFAYLLYLAARFVRAVETIAENSNRSETDADE